MDDVAPPVAVGEEPPVGAGASAAAVHCGGPQQYVCLHFGSVFTDSSSLSNAAATLLLSLKLLSSLIIGPLVFCFKFGAADGRTITLGSWTRSMRPTILGLGPVLGEARFVQSRSTM